MITSEQQAVIDAVVAGDNVLLTGQGGVGKTHVVHEVVSTLSRRGRKVGVCATTGAAAVLIRGKTLHSYLGIGLARETAGEIARKIKANKRSHETWKTTDLLIIDEVSMCSDLLLDKLESVARQVRRNDEPFGGIQLLLSGDFLQLPCIDGDFAFSAECWERLHLSIFNLQTIQRQSDSAFQELLGRVRMGAATNADVETLLKQREFPKDGILPTRILCLNDDVDAINHRELKRLGNAEENTYDIEIEWTNKSVVEHEILTERHCNAVKSLTLAVGAQVMLIFNLDNSGLVNGSRGVVNGFTTDGLPIVQFIDIVEQRTIGYQNWDVLEDVRGKQVKVAVIYQIPLRLAWAITVHKSQGATIDRAIVDLKGVFEFGQAYVALSRVRSLAGLLATNISTKSFRAHADAVKFYETLLVVD